MKKYRYWDLMEIGLIMALVISTAMWIYGYDANSRLNHKIDQLNTENRSLTVNSEYYRIELEKFRNYTGPQATPTAKDGFTDIETLDPGIIVDLKFASEDNFTGKRIYDYSACIFTDATANKLEKISEIVKVKGYFLKIMDGYRKPQASWDIWNTYPDPKYISNPDLGDNKCKGVTVDITLTDSYAVELAMPSAYMDLTVKASGSEAQEIAYGNWQYLKSVMTQNGFTASTDKWWEYTDSNAASYEIVDLNVVQLFK